MLLNTEEQKGNGRTCFWRWRRRLQRWCGYFRSTAFHSFPRYAHCPPFFDFSVLEMQGLLFLSLIVFCLLWFRDEGQQTMVMLVVNNLWFSVVLFFFAGTKTMAGLICDSPLPFSPSLCIFLYLCSVFALLFSSVPPLVSGFIFLPLSLLCQLLGIYSDQSSSPSA